MRLAIAALTLASVLAAADQPQTELTVTAGQPVQYRFGFKGTELAYRATGLPAGLSIDPATGAIHGSPAVAGVSDVDIIAENRLGSATISLRIVVLAAPAKPTAAAPPPPPPTSAGEGDEDEADPMLASGAAMHPWTDNQRRVIHHWFLPGAATLPAGDWYYRISHVARVGYDEQPRTNLLGLDDDVRIGLAVGWSPAKATTLTLQRTNGRDLAMAPVDGKAVAYDTWDTTAQVQLFDQRGVRGLWHGPFDLALVAGWSWMLRNHGTGDTSLNLGAVVERDFFDDQLRLGVGIYRIGLSAYDSAIGTGPANKPFPDEQAYLASQGLAQPKVENGTTAVPITARIALNQHWFLLGESVIPVGGWDTGKGPALAGGVALDTNTHEFSFIFTNTANTAMNSVVTGGAIGRALPFFAFAITAYF